MPDPIAAWETSPVDWIEQENWAVRRYPAGHGDAI
jgi:hypothetical protein